MILLEDKGMKIDSTGMCEGHHKFREVQVIYTYIIFNIFMIHDNNNFDNDN